MMNKKHGMIDTKRRTNHGKTTRSIFNDVLGPVMRGPSSSHVAGAARIASMIRQSLDAPVKKAIVDFDVNGALAASHTGHGTDMGFASGLLNMELDAPDVAQYEAIAKERGLEIEYRILDYGAEHPGNYRAEVWDQNGNVVHWEAIAVGGGMVEMQKYEGFSVQIAGDFYELLVIADVALGIEEKIEALLPDAEFFQSDQKNDQILYNWKLAVPLTKEVIQAVRDVAGVSQACYLEPVLPTHSSSTCQVPFSTAAALVDYAKEHPMESWEYALEYEACRGGQSREAVYRQMEQILSVMEQAVETGLAGTKYRDRILGEQVSKVAAAEQAGRLIPDPIVNEIIRCITAVMESKSSMGVIVAAPTCGSCGCLPGTVIGLARALSLPRETVVQGLLVAGLVGVFFAEEATFSAEVAGCQVECGAGSGMAAAALTAMMGGTIENCMDAASVGLQNITGLACDPVGNRVEWPCLGKNIMGGSNALASANMILAGYDKVIPLDETIGAIYEIGLSLPLELRCTFGGLGKTKTAREILKRSDAHFPGEEAR